MELSVLVLAVLVLGIALVLILKRPKSVDGISLDELNRLKGENERLKINEAKAVERAEGLGLERERLEIKLNEINAELSVEKGRIAKAEEAFKAQRDRLNEQQEYIDKLQQQFKTEFENIANKLLEEKSNKFTEQNHKQLDIILSPFKEKLKDFEEKVEKAYKAESDERNTLKGEIKNLVELNKVMSAEAQNLTKALKGDAKKQGNWGEVVLERVLERSGLVRDREYRVQASLSGQDGNRLQPDVIIDLPDNKHLVVDSKVSLVAYERLVNCESDEDRLVFAKAHVESIKNHVKDLSSKNYHDLYQINSPDFVLLFVPIESSFSMAVQSEQDLFDFAWERRVVIVSPSTLLATLTTVASIWKQERQNKNVMEIARLSGAMYDKFEGFVKDLEGVGKTLRQSQNSYEDAMKKLTSGNGNLTVTAEKIKKLGAKASKQIDQKFIDEESLD
ncbi:MAG: recombination protein RmuC [Bacteroidota bacterium]|jgi:DNA recombination protein RmuC